MCLWLYGYAKSSMGGGGWGWLELLVCLKKEDLQFLEDKGK